jgi:fructose-bisphosphate aldolase class I
MSLDTHREELEATAAALARPGTGLLAADESTGTIGKRFAAIGVENSEENRRAYRTLLATTPGLETAISGVILHEETLYQEATPIEGRPGGSILDLFLEQGLVAGIKLDLGVEPLAGGLAGETWCTGLRGLQERAARAYARGARSPNGGPCCASVPMAAPRSCACVRTPGGWPATPARPRRRAWCRSWSRRS